MPIIITSGKRSSSTKVVGEICNKGYCD